MPETPTTYTYEPPTNTWEKSTVLSLLIFLIGFILPPLWLLNLIYKSTKNNKTYFFVRASLIALFLVLALLYCGGWATLVTFMLLKTKGTPRYPYANDPDFPYYWPVKNKSKIEIGEYVAMVFLPLISLVLLWEVIVSLVQMFSIRRLMNKLRQP